VREFDGSGELQVYTVNLPVGS